MGDSYGPFRGFEHIDDDICAAIDQMYARLPGLRDVILWGECDASAAILFYAFSDPRVAGIVLLNPWARTEEGQAKAVLRHYYLARLVQPSFWKKVLALRFNPLRSLQSGWEVITKSRSGNRTWGAPRIEGALDRSLPLPDRLLTGFNRFNGPVLLIMSGRDLIAREFDEVIKGSPVWDAVLAAKPTTRRDIKDADHTFSSAAQRELVIEYGLAWLASIATSGKQ
jgi:exosortase A-associated hydrolase 1